MISTLQKLYDERVLLNDRIVRDLKDYKYQGKQGEARLDHDTQQLVRYDVQIRELELKIQRGLRVQ